jgi:hypothetical protein
VSDDLVYEMTARGEIPSLQRGRRRVIPLRAIEILIERSTEIVICTAKNAPKVSALRHNPAVALTIDTEVQPSKRSC